MAFALGAAVMLGIGWYLDREAAHWSDGDSGRIGRLPFRLMDVDAPETTMRHAECQEEKALGLAAGEFMRNLTRGKRVEIIETDGYDQYNRLLVKLRVGGVDIIEAGLAAGHLRPDPHDRTRSLGRHPDWCG